MTVPTCKIIQGDCIEVLKTLPAESVQCCVTSPPYDALRTCYLPLNFEGAAAAIHRVLSPGGVLSWNVADQMVNGSETLTAMRQAIFFVDQCGFLMHDTMIYQKRNFSHPEKNRYHQVWEYVFVLTKGPIRTFNPIMDRPNLTAGKVGNLGVNTFTEADGTKGVREKKMTREMGMRHNVWLGNTRGQEEMCVELKHPAMMPKWLARDLIISFSNPGDMVCDPFFGSGTTGEVSLELGRNCIGIELNPDYCELAWQRTSITPGLPI
jgi:DNA modification methylase